MNAPCEVKDSDSCKQDDYYRHEVKKRAFFVRSKHCSCDHRHADQQGDISRKCGVGLDKRPARK